MTFLRTPSSPKATTTNTATNNNSTPSPAGKRHQSLHTPVPRSRSTSRESSPFGSSDTTASNNNAVTDSNHPHRTRFNSRDLLDDSFGNNNYNNDYENCNDSLLPLECLKQQQYLNTKLSFMVFLSTYLTCVLALQLVAAAILSNDISWTITNFIHCFVTLIYIHWEKGSFLLSDEQGELNGMTVWEQLEATPESAVHMRRTLQIVPTVITYTACVTAHFQQSLCIINIIFWLISMLAKLPFMNGVRLFGINRTAGIDDDTTTTACVVTDDTNNNENDNNNNANVSDKKHQ